MKPGTQVVWFKANPSGYKMGAKRIPAVVVKNLGVERVRIEFRDVSGEIRQRVVLQENVEVVRPSFESHRAN